MKWIPIKFADDYPKGLGRDVLVTVDLRDGEPPISSCGYWNATVGEFYWNQDSDDPIEMGKESDHLKPSKVLAWQEKPEPYTPITCWQCADDDDMGNVEGRICSCHSGAGTCDLVCRPNAEDEKMGVDRTP